MTPAKLVNKHIGHTRVVMTRKLNSTIKYEPSTRSNSKSNVTLATCDNIIARLSLSQMEKEKRIKDKKKYISDNTN